MSSLALARSPVALGNWLASMALSCPLCSSTAVVLHWATLSTGQRPPCPGGPWASFFEGFFRNAVLPKTLPGFSWLQGIDLASGDNGHIFPPSPRRYLTGLLGFAARRSWCRKLHVLRHSCGEALRMGDLEINGAPGLSAGEFCCRCGSHGALPSFHDD